MARMYSMSYEGFPNFRWSKMYKGKRYRVSCQQLQQPETKNDSYIAVNGWWLKKKLEIDGELPANIRPAIKEIERRIEWAQQFDASLLPNLETNKAFILGCENYEPLPDEIEIEKGIASAKLLGIEISEFTDPITVQHFFGDERIWKERFAFASTKTQTKNVGECVVEFLSVALSKLKPASYRELSKYFTHTFDAGIWLKQTSVATINEELVSKHYSWIASKQYCSGGHNKYLQFFRRFIHFLYESNFIEHEPRNIKSKIHRKRLEHKIIQTFPAKVVQETLASLPQNLKLAALLGLNSGCTNVDLAELTWNMFDLKNKLLTRRRIKTGSNTNTPTVTYKLFPETLFLLRAIPNKTGLVFLTSKNTKMKDMWIDESGNVKAKDMFAVQWRRAIPKPKIQLKSFRSIAATALRSSLLYRSFDQYFLGHSPKTVSERHYSAESNQPFFKALEHVRKIVLLD